MLPHLQPPRGSLRGADSAAHFPGSMAAPSQPVLPSIFSLCDLSALDDDPAWLPLEGTLSSVSCLGFAADSMFASDLDPLSGGVAVRRVPSG